MDQARIDELVNYLKEVVNAASLNAIKVSRDVQNVIRELEQAGFKIRLTVGVAVRRLEEPVEFAARVGAQRRTCPHCSTDSTPFYMKATIVKDRVKSEGEHDVIEGFQVRFHCSLCGYGEVEPVPPEDP